MLSQIESKFNDNEIGLANSFSFEKLGTQLHLLAGCPESFAVTPSFEVQRKSKLLFERLTNQTNMSASLKNTLLYVQIRTVIDEYISSTTKN